ncbi:MAG: 50S ribosomal protein L21 [Patescibacteria group bacterium]|jgi:large subunit ribosomal protein L21
MFAVISYNGNQYKFEENKEYNIALIETSEKDIVFDDVLLVSTEKEILVGEPNVKGASVKAEIIGLARGKKLTAMKFKAKARVKKTLGHKQDYTRIKVITINS